MNSRSKAHWPLERKRPLAEGSSSITLERTHLADAENARLKAQIRELESRVVQPQHATGDTKHVLQLETVHIDAYELPTSLIMLWARHFKRRQTNLQNFPKKKIGLQRRR